MSAYPDDILDPLAEYRDRLRHQFAQNCSDLFESLVTQSGVDATANSAQIGEIRYLKAEATTCSNRRSWVMLAAVLAWVFVAISIFLLAVTIASSAVPEIALPLHIDGRWVLPTALVSIGILIIALILIAKHIHPMLKALQNEIARLNAAIQAKMNEAWAGMAPLNRLYDWNVFAKLLMQTLPRWEMDPYFTRGRLAALQRDFGWTDAFNDDRSVIFSQSGAINGNPFVLAETLDFAMGSKVYYGSKHISWRTRQYYTDAKGRRRSRMVTRHQTLTASVTKPAPHYERSKFLIYGNEAAPTLSFSRQPSNLSGLGDDVISRWRRSAKVRRLERLSRNFDDDSDYTIMSNRQFAALFHARDRDDEIQFRLLFTVLAQQNMVNLLQDQSVGYGDNFTFIKSNRINAIFPAHLTDLDLDAAPSHFAHYNLQAARDHFNHFFNDYFRAFYFTLAPLLTIPLYQQHRSHGDIYKDTYSTRASFWEHESMANHLGEQHFSHPNSITKNILKTKYEDSDHGSSISVTAHGFTGRQRTTHVSVRGGDGKRHNVPVRWIEYTPVRQVSKMAVGEADDLDGPSFKEAANASEQWRSFFRQWGDDATFRRSLVGVLQRPS